jgi:DNA-binding response OmpR family regulator
MYSQQTSRAVPHQILLVADKNNPQDLFCRRLERAGYLVFMTVESKAGLDILSSQKIDLVILDLAVAGMAGLKMLQQIRTSHSWSQLPVVMMTGTGQSDEMVQALNSGANDCVTHPLDVPVVLARIQSLLRHLKTSALSTPPVPVAESKVISPSAAISSAVPAPPSQIPDLAGRYTKGKTLIQSEGIFSYLAEDTHHPDQPHCVIDELRLCSELTRYETAASRFFQSEVSICKGLGNSQTAVRIRDFFQEGQRFYLVKDFVEGQLLSEELQLRRPLVLRNILGLAINLLKVVKPLHERSIIHQSLQPSSFLRSSLDQRLILVDFGIANRLAATLQKQYHLSPLLSARASAYSAPEQSKGMSFFSSDIYTIGMILLEALTRKTPDHIPTDSQTGEFCWKSLVSVGVGFEAILDKMIHPQPKQRYASIQKVLDDIHQLPMVALFKENERSLVKS